MGAVRLSGLCSGIFFAKGPMTDPISDQRTLPVSWEVVHRHTRTLASRLAKIGPWTGIVAVARGGLVPAAIIARELDIRLVETVCVASYDDRTRGNITILKRPDGDGNGWIVIDDVADTGGTLKALRPLLPRAHFATIYVKPEGQPYVDSFVSEVAQEIWIRFPWETTEENR